MLIDDQTADLEDGPDFRLLHAATPEAEQFGLFAVAVGGLLGIWTASFTVGLLAALCGACFVRVGSLFRRLAAQ